MKSQSGVGGDKFYLKTYKAFFLFHKMINNLEIRIKKLNPDAKIPTSSNEHAAGFDIYSCEDYELKPGETYAVKTGISMEIPSGKVCLIWDRSGMGFKGIHRFAGVIDSDYRGEFKIILFNSTKQSYSIKKHDRIAQGIIQDYYKPEFIEVEELEDSERGHNWNSSTGR